MRNIRLYDRYWGIGVVRVVRVVRGFLASLDADHINGKVTSLMGPGHWSRGARDPRLKYFINGS